MKGKAGPINQLVTQSDIVGLWRRSYLKAPVEAPSFEDHETHVYWFQADGLYADLRIPKRFADGVSVSKLSDLSGEDLTMLSASEGFAGIATVEASICTWQRVINLQGPEEGRDIGRLVNMPEGLFEYGVEADFIELWLNQNVCPSAVQGRAFLADGEFLSFLVTSPTRFLFACDRPARTAHKIRWREALADALAKRDIEQLNAVFEPEYSFGRIENGAAIIEVSSHPNRVGALLSDGFQIRAGVVTTYHQRFDGAPFQHRWTPSNLEAWAR